MSRRVATAVRTFLLVWLGLSVVFNVVMYCVAGHVGSFIVAVACACAFGWNVVHTT